MKIKACLSKQSDHWATPKNIYNQAIKAGMYDPCPLHSKKDGLTTKWQKKNFVNPPYSQLKTWIKKSIEEHKKGNEIILLIPARPDTKWFKDLYEYGSEITFITGRLHFNESNTAPFPSMIVNLCGGGYKKTKCKLITKEEIKL